MTRFAKRGPGAAVVLVGHVTKDGQIAGPRVVEHMVDAVLYFEGDTSHMFRILRGVKNRYGATDEIGVFEMTERGLTEVANPSALFLDQRDTKAAGSAVFAGIEGTRPLLIEIQALVAPSPLGTPRRAVVGWDSARLSMILAVLETRCGVRIGANDIYLNVAGGLKVSEPAADIAVAAALISFAVPTHPLPADAVFFGEISLSAGVRPVSHRRSQIARGGQARLRTGILRKGRRVRPWQRHYHRGFRPSARSGRPHRRGERSRRATGLTINVRGRFTRPPLSR